LKFKKIQQNSRKFKKIQLFIGRIVVRIELVIYDVHGFHLDQLSQFAI